MKASNEIKQAKINVELSLNYSIKIKKNDRIKVTSSNDINNYLRPLYKNIELSEKFIAIFLSRSNDIIGHNILSIGSVTGTVVDIKQIMMIAALSNASGVIVSHNHPSGNLNPSQADINVTRNLKEICKMVDCQLLDHIIITDDYYYSFADQGMI